MCNMYMNYEVNFDVETGRVAIGLWAAIGLLHAICHFSKQQKQKGPQITVGLRDRIAKFGEERFTGNDEE